MSQPDYSALEKSKDATAFSRSRFGKHYLARLEAARARYLETSMNSEYTDSYRAHAASKASVIDRELEYFKIAQTIQESPNLIDRLRKKLIEKLEKEDDKDV